MGSPKVSNAAADHPANPALEMHVLNLRLDEERAQGDFDVASVSKKMLEHTIAQKKEGLYGYDRYVEVVDAGHSKVHDGEKIVECIVWNTNTYLGLIKDDRVIKAAQDALVKYGTGVGTSFVNGGRSTVHKNLEDRLAKGLQKEAVLIF